MPKVRLHKYLADCGVASRRKAETLIAAGQVSVNGEIVGTPGTSVEPDRDRVCVKGQRVNPAAPRLFIFNKPRNVITTMSDPQGRKTVADYLRKVPIRLFPVGRLDYDVVGLLLVTNDGELANKLLHPRYGVGRRYLALVGERPSGHTLTRLTAGIKLGDAIKKASSARLVRPGKALESLFPAALIKQHCLPEKSSGTPAAGAIVELVVHEGEKHFVKRFLARAGHPVLALARVGFGPYQLGDLQPGELREVEMRGAWKGSDKPSS